MAEVRTPPAQLRWDIFVTPGIPSITTDLPPGAKQRLWSPMSSTLISGKRDAVLVDTFITVEQASALADWERPRRGSGAGEGLGREIAGLDHGGD